VSEILIVLSHANPDVNLNEAVVLSVTLMLIALLHNGELHKNHTLVVTLTLDTNVFPQPHVKLMKTVVVLILPSNTLHVLKDKISVLSAHLIFIVPTDLERPVLLADKNVLFAHQMSTAWMLTLAVISELTSVPGLLVFL